MYKIQLRRVEVAEDIFNKILEDGAFWIEEYKDIKSFYYGKNNPINKTNLIYYNGKDEMICQELRIHEAKRSYMAGDSFTQVVVRLDPRLKDGEYKTDLTGFRAYLKLRKILLKYYTVEELEECYNKFNIEYDKELTQFHYFNTDTRGKVLKFNNCVKYDINGAHADALLEIFPKAKEAILKIYKDRKKDEKNKSLINYFVGYLCRAGYRNTYNWIVQRTTKILLKAIEEVGGELIYANTDGFAVCNPIKTIEISKELGDFKEEYKGTVYNYGGENYYIYQFGDEFKGSIMKDVRHLFDLANGKVVSYDRVYDSIAKIYKSENIKVKGVEVYETESINY